MPPSTAPADRRDLRRFLDGEVVEAYADRRAYRLSRFAARHRALLSVAGVSALLLAAPSPSTDSEGRGALSSGRR